MVKEECKHMDWCFFQIVSLEIETVVFFENNKAGVAGDSVYGGLLEHCDIMNARSMIPLREGRFWTIFNVVGTKSLSEVSSSPYQVCFCDANSPASSCTVKTAKKVFRGQDFSILAAAVGQFRGVSPATVQAQLFTTGHEGKLGARQNVQQLGQACEELTYSIRTLETHIQLLLTVETSSDIEVEPAVINVKHLDLVHMDSC